jgi:hypothetical protein
MLPAMSGILPGNSAGLRVALHHGLHRRFAIRTRGRRQHAGGSEQNARAPLP